MRRRRFTHREEGRIRHAINDRVMHFSPTISPAPKNEERNEIESLLEAIQYYQDAGEKCVIMQPKYMGSYCDIYINIDIEKTRFFSRKGYPLPKWMDHKALIEAVKPIHERLYDFWTVGAEWILVQAELMPWSSLGKGLIDREFRGYQKCHQDHCDYLKETGFKELINSLKMSEHYQNYLVDKGLLSKRELRSKTWPASPMHPESQAHNKAMYPDHIIKQYEALSSIEIPDAETYQSSIDIYREQVDIYGAEGELHFKPFNVLKIIYEDSKEDVNESNIAGFGMVFDPSTDRCAIIHFNKGEDRLKSDTKEALKLYKKWVEDEKMEGAVVKPDTVWKKDMVPMFKVRNPRYLQMIYGVKFLPEFDYYMSRRNIKRKMRCSINEWNIAQSLLRIPMKDISPDNETYTKLVRARILEEDFEATLDSRL